MDEKFIYLFVIASLTICQAILPFVGRKTQCFGVSVPSSKYNFPKLTINRWAYAVAAVLVSFVAVSYTLKNTITEARFTMIMVFLLIGYYFLYLIYHKKTKEIKKEEGWGDNISSTTVADLTPPSKGYLSPIWLSLYGAVFLVTLMLTGILYSRMPAQLPMNYDFAGNVTRTVDKTTLAVLFPVITQFLMGALFIGIYYMNLNSERKIDPSNPDESKKALNVFRNQWAIYTMVIGLLTMGIFLCITLSYAGIISGALIGIYGIGIAVVSIVYAIYLSIKIGQGGSLLAKSNSDSIGYNDKDEQWKAGMFYVNKDDPAIFLEKRFGIGWTLNYGNPKAIMITVGFIVIMLLFTWLSLKI